MQRAGELELIARIAPAVRAELLAALGETRETLDLDLRPLPETVLPVQVLVEQTARDFARFRRFETARGFCHTGPDRDYIVLSAENSDLLRVARHEMTHRHLNRSGPWLPDWLEEGLAEYYSTLRRSGTTVTLGVEIEAHRRTLALAGGLDAALLTQPNPHSAATPPDANRSALFYAQSWAVVHYLISEPDRRARLLTFLARISAGAVPEAAYPAVFSEPLAATLEKVRDYLNRPSLPLRTVRGVAAPAPGPAAVVSQDDVQALRARIHLALGQREEADPIWKSLADQGSAPDARASDRLAMLALARQDFGAARAALERSIQLGSRNPEVWFEYAMLLRDSRAPDAEVERHLDRVLELAPAFAPAWAQLAKSKDRRGATREAEADLRKAAGLDPRRFEYLEAHAEILHRLGMRDESLALIRGAIRVARTPSELEQARSLEVLWQQEGSKPGATISAGKPEVRTPDSWKPAPGSTASGEITRIDCDGAALVFHLQSPAGLLRLEAPDLAQITIAGSGPGRSFTCGPQSPALPVTATYTPATSATPARLLRLEMR